MAVLANTLHYNRITAAHLMIVPMEACSSGQFV